MILTTFDGNNCSTNMKIRNVETITDTRFSLKPDPFIHTYNKTVRFNYNRSSRRQVPRDFPAEFQRSSRVEGMPEIQA